MLLPSLSGESDIASLGWATPDQKNFIGELWENRKWVVKQLQNKLASDPDWGKYIKLRTDLEAETQLLMQDERKVYQRAFDRKKVSDNPFGCRKPRIDHTARSE